MSSLLQKIPFSEALLPRVQAFDCGAEPWQREVSDWIKAPRGAGGALDQLLQPGSQVWLYAAEQGSLVGFGSLAIGSQRWPRPKDPPIETSVIPVLGVDQRFWGQPAGPPEDRYSARILDDLIAEASAHRDARPILVLYVSLDNARGITFYERAGFQELHKSWTDKNTGRVYKRMFLVLPEVIG